MDTRLIARNLLPNKNKLDIAPNLIALLFYTIGVLIFFRGEWLLSPLRSFGDNADGSIIIATLEHWCLYYSGVNSSWLDPGWFWPTSNALSNTDTYFLYSIPYSIAQLIGFNIYESYDFTIWTLGTIGFWTFYLLATQSHSIKLVASAFSYVFAFGLLWLMKLGHGQTYTVMLLPSIISMIFPALMQNNLRGTG